MSREFTNKPISINHEWLDEVSRVVYDVLGNPKTVGDVKNRFGINEPTVQPPAGDVYNERLVSISGGSINGTSVGNTIPASGRFTDLRSTEMQPTEATQVVNRGYLDYRLSGLDAIQEATRNLKGLAFQPSDNVSISGGNGRFNVLQVSSEPTSQNDAVNLAVLKRELEKAREWAEGALAEIAHNQRMAGLGYTGSNTQAPSPGLPVTAKLLQTQSGCMWEMNAYGNRVFRLPFAFKPGNLVVFVDGVFQLPDTYAAAGPDSIVFFDPTPPKGALVGAFTIGATDEHGNYIDVAPSSLQILQSVTPFDKCRNGTLVFLPFEIKSGMVLFIDGVYQLPDVYDITSPTSLRLRHPVPADAVVSGFTV